MFSILVVMRIDRNSLLTRHCKFKLAINCAASKKWSIYANCLCLEAFFFLSFFFFTQFFRSFFFFFFSASLCFRLQSFILFFYYSSFFFHLIVAFTSMILNMLSHFCIYNVNSSQTTNNYSRE